jgi:hypothetical protein
LGGMTVEEMLRRMSTEEMHHWMALYQMEAEERAQADVDARAMAGLPKQ